MLNQRMKTSWKPIMSMTIQRMKTLVKKIWIPLATFLTNLHRHPSLPLTTMKTTSTVYHPLNHPPLEPQLQRDANSQVQSVHQSPQNPNPVLQASFRQWIPSSTHPPPASPAPSLPICARLSTLFK